MELKTGLDDEGRRLDRVLRKALPERPLSLIHRLLRQGQILLNGRPAKPGARVKAGDTIGIAELARGTGFRGAAQKPGAPPAGGSPPPRLPVGALVPFADILWQGSGLLILNKAAGIAVHGPESLDAAVRSILAGRLSPSLSFKPGPLHRLDKPTSGVIVFSSSLEGARLFSALLRQGHVKKYYLALVEGTVKGPEVWEDKIVRDGAAKKTFIAGDRDSPQPERGRKAAPGSEAKPQAALTRIIAAAAGKQGNAGFSLVLAEIETGRTHQIRAQAAARGHPLAGDKKYGGRYQPGGFLLHARKLEFAEGRNGILPRSITAPLPENFRARIRELFGEAFILPFPQGKGI
ncbi:MAG: RluA family pseudouridine synthase [Treponema sp.]|jgi:23S rRNA pseudouridine955/2504/2580 synthase|nr:RluA family pseudouridine synthase [Treponema sp.]